MGFALKNKQGRWVKRTCRFGAFHGAITVTEKEVEARVWTLKKDAERALWVLNYRCNPEEKTWNHKERNRVGELSYEVVEHD